MIPSPILRALSTIRKHHVEYLLMGGQACVLYGAAEFSRDLDLAILSEPSNLDRLSSALHELSATVIAIPPFQSRFLEEGLAVHFRCGHPEAEGLRIDVMTRMRGVDPFPNLWERRTTFEFGEESIEVLSLPDLITAKKTQRDKDWPMIRRLVDAHFAVHRGDPTPERVSFWLRELRTPDFLVDVASAHPASVAKLLADRPLLALATPVHLADGTLQSALRDEESAERNLDAEYWRPLRKRLEELRRQRRDLEGSEDASDPS